MRPRIVVLAALLTACGAEKPAGTLSPVRVAAAADLAFAFEEVGTAFAAASGRVPRFSFGSTGQLAQQIMEGAPYDVFAAANVSFANDVVKAGACLGETQALYGRGRIVLWWPDSTTPPPAGLADLARPEYVHIAIANPEHAPYGRAAKQALETAGVWPAVEPKLVYGQNIQQTLQFATSGNAEVAIVANSLALRATGGKFVPVDESQHRPIDQALVVCKNGGDIEGGKAFAAFVASPAGRAIMKRHGFVLPGE